MRYREYIDRDGHLNKEWRDERDCFHREDGPAIILIFKGGFKSEEFWYSGICQNKFGPAIIDYNSDGSILREEYRIGRFHLGNNKDGFWALWDILNEEERKHTSVLKLLARYS